MGAISVPTGQPLGAVQVDHVVEQCFFAIIHSSILWEQHRTAIMLINFHSFSTMLRMMIPTDRWSGSSCAKEGPGQAVEENLSSHRSCLCKMCEAEMMPGQARRRNSMWESVQNPHTPTDRSLSCFPRV